MKILLSLICVSLLFSTGYSAALAAGESTAAGIEAVSLEAYPTFNCIGLRLAYKGDSDSNAVARVRYREKGADAWRQALDLARIKDSRFAGSVFFLNSGTAYEVEVRLDDSGGVKGVKTSIIVSTRAENFPAGTGRTWYVSPLGDDAAAGTVENPLHTISAAAERVKPGDVVRVAPGTYREQVKLSRSGKKEAYITFSAAGPGVILTGADPAYDLIPATPLWHSEGDGVYSASPGYTTRFLAADEKRLYHYVSREVFDEFICGEPGGWFQDQASGKLYLKLSSGADPNLIPV
ncbi:MAG TPA: DUF1565 domain-containing protein, partial [Candidatus Glassbacteria bacterium]|nr:DUF1565 domain-containing protein [Candidatus Glassbacteria bacterium]